VTEFLDKAVDGGFLGTDRFEDGGERAFGLQETDDAGGEITNLDGPDHATADANLDG
jgi:hypothetical protein